MKNENAQPSFSHSTFFIPKMDCPSEENLIRMALGDLPEIRSLAFDLPKRQVKAIHQNDPESVWKRLQPLKLGAKLVESYLMTSEQAASPRNNVEDADEARTLYLLLAINGAMFFS
jgi:hypothetical protein